MKTLVILLISICFLQSSLVSCNQVETSEIERITVDSAFIQTQIAGHDSVNIDSSNEYKNLKTTYYFKDSSTVVIYHDSLQRLRAWFKKKNGKMLEGAEIHETTGQIMGKLNFVNGIIDGKVKYYYDDGRVKSKGIFKNGRWWGEWKNFNVDGELETIKYYNENGKIIRTDSIKKPED